MRSIAFDRLSIRLVVGIALLVACPLAVVLTVVSKQHYDHTIDTRRREAERHNRILEATLRHQMMEKDTTLITAILRDIGSQPDVRNAMILDHDGRVRFSSAPELLDQVIARDSPACLVCHSKAPEERETWVLLDDSDGGALRSVLPIRNRVECHTCHDPGNELNGILILDWSLADAQARLRRDVAWMAAGTAVLAILVLVGMGILVRKLIFVRLGKLGRTARAIATGDLNERAAEDGRDVISSLATDFNNMADSLSRLIVDVRDREAQLAAVMNGLEDGLVVLDRDLRVVAANRSFSRRAGVHPEALRGRHCGKAGGLALPCCESGGDCPAARCLVTGEVQRAVFHLPGEGEETGIVEEVYASPVYLENGQVVKVVEVWRDISERVREEERLAEIERLASLGVLASGFSHEVNTPLASMLTCAESALGRIAEVDGERSAQSVLPDIRESAETIRRQVLRCRKITEQFLRFSRGIPPSIELIDLRLVTEGIVALTAPTAREAGATIRIEGATEVPAVRANTEVVQHVILNLLVNAIQSLDGTERGITLRFLVGRDVRVRIEDTGCGIAREARKHLFEPFRSQKAHGTGLGLFLSRSFMRRFGGDVRLARTEVGVGSCFEILFPRAVNGQP